MRRDGAYYLLPDAIAAADKIDELADEIERLRGMLRDTLQFVPPSSGSPNCLRRDIKKEVGYEGP